MPSVAIECIELSKIYGKRITALNYLTLNIEEGASFGLLGENGAGKSTLVRLIMGFIFPTVGQVRVLGEEKVAWAHPRIGYVHERPIFETRFTGWAYLTYLAELSGLWGYASRARIEELLERVNLYEAADRRIGTYSKGMLQRLSIAQALLTNPELLILDEPTSGLDPRSQWEVRQIIAALRKQGKTVLLCSHYLAEVEALCDTVGILRRGELLLSGTVADLLHSQDVVEIVLAENEPAEGVVVRLGLTEQVIESRGNVLRVPGSAQAIVLAALVNAGVAILGTVVMVQRAMNARVYLPLARLTSRSAYVRGLILATGVLCMPLFLMLMLLAMAYHQFSPPSCHIGDCIEGATIVNMSIGALGLIVNCIVLSTLTVVLSVPIATRRIQIVFLAWLAAVLYSNSNFGPVASALAVTRIPLAPLAACFGFGTTGIVGWYGVLMVIVAVGYVVGLTLLAGF